MKVLIVGSGGREHAIAWKVAQSPKVDKIYCAPGNAGIEEYAECVNIGAMEFDKLVAFAKEKAIDLTVIGMDDPLVGGVVDAFEAEGLRVFGPRKNAAILEGSKAFSKDLMKKYNIPTAAYENFTDPQEALTYLETAKFPIVLKADGLALGKGVLICNTLEEAKDGVKEIMEDKKFGNAGNTMVIEEFMTGREVSVLTYVDGKTIKPMTSAQDHKRAQDGDQGLNTGGMGTFSPSPFYTEDVDAFCKAHIYQATVDAMAAEGREFKGIIFFGLMLTADGPKVLEYNARFGDPEAQVVLPRMKTDIIDVFEACIDGTLDQINLEFEDNAAVCVVLASDGYPVSYQKGFPIKGLDAFKEKEGYYVFHAGTAKKDGQIVTNGGRVLGVVAKGDDLKQARANAYKAIDLVEFDNKYYRHDIGKAINPIALEGQIEGGVVMSLGYALTYKTEEIPVVGVKASGVKAITLKNDTVVSGILYNENAEYLTIITDKKTAKRVKLQEFEITSRARRGIQLVREVKSNPYTIIKAFIIHYKEILNIKTASELIELKLTEIPIAERLSTGSTIAKTKILDVYPNYELVSGIIEEKQEKENISLEEIDKKMMTIDDFLDNIE